MGRPKYLYFEDRIADLLALEENASSLVNSLLVNYYNSLEKTKPLSLEQQEINISKSIETLKQEADKLEKDRLEMINQININKEKEILDQNLRFKDLELASEINRLKKKYKEEHYNFFSKDFTPKLMAEIREQALKNLGVI